MLKKSLTMITLLCAMVPMVAHAASWSLATRVSTAGGTITSRNTALAQTSANGTVFKTYTTTAAVPVTITANAGYAVSAVTVNGIAKSPVPGSPTTYQMGSGLDGASRSSQAVVVSFVKQAVTSLIPVTISAATGGGVSPLPGTYRVAPGSTATVTFTPMPGYKLSAVSGATCTYKDANTGVVVTGLPYAGAVRASFTVPASGTVTIAGSFTADAAVSATASPASATVNSAVTLQGAVTPSTGALYSWAQTAGPAVTLSNINAQNPTFTPTANGTYTFKLTASNSAGIGTATVSVNVTGGAVASVNVRNQCINCHNSAGVDVVNGINVVYQKWSSSKHEANNVSCATCHVGADTGAHPGVTVTSAACENCHAAKLSTTTHPVAITASKCLDCHDSHDPAAGIANLGQAPAHPAVTLYTFEEIGMQMNNGNPVPVQVDANGKGMPYSPKQTCGTAGCHIKNGVDYTYDKISDHAFHSNQGRSEYVDSLTGKFDATKNKPWTQSTAMVGKW